MLRLIALAVLLATSSCSTSGALRGPTQADQWLEVQSPHFDLQTDLPLDEAKARVVEFEDTYALLSDLAFHSATPPDKPFDVVVFRTIEDFKEVAPKEWEVSFSKTINHREVLVFPARFGDPERMDFQFELALRFAHFFMPKAPPWLSNGMAHYYATLRVDGENAVLGTSPYAFWRGSPAVLAGGARHVDVERLPAASDVIKLTRDEFYGDDGYDARQHAIVSWLLVHMLISGPDAERARFWSFVTLMTEHADPNEAWHRLFDGIPVDDEVRAYARRGVVSFARLPYHRPPPIDVAQLTTHALANDDVHALWSAIGRGRKARQPP